MKYLFLPLAVLLVACGSSGETDAVDDASTAGEHLGFELSTNKDEQTVDGWLDSSRTVQILWAVGQNGGSGGEAFKCALVGSEPLNDSLTINYYHLEIEGKEGWDQTWLMTEKNDGGLIDTLMIDSYAKEACGGYQQRLLTGDRGWRIYLTQVRVTGKCPSGGVADSTALQLTYQVEDDGDIVPIP